MKVVYLFFILSFYVIRDKDNYSTFFTSEPFSFMTFISKKRKGSNNEVSDVTHSPFCLF